MAADQPAKVGDGAVHEFSFDGSRLGTYYGQGSFLKNKHVATESAADAFPRWALDVVAAVPASRALDAGCGWGRFAVPFLEHRGGAASLTCSDVYPGMLATARETVTAAGYGASFVAADIERMPFASASFEFVMANHVLYHMRHVIEAARELARLLTATGVLMATTNSDLVRVPLLEIHHAVLADLGVYTNTGRYLSVISDEKLDPAVRGRVAFRFAEHAQEWMRADGEIRSPQRMCAFVCQGPRA